MIQLWWIMRNVQHIVSRVPRASRHFQMGILKNLERRFQDLIQLPALDHKKITQHMYLSKELLIDIRHIMVYQSFDHDLRERLMNQANAIVSYINSFMVSLQKEI